MSEPLGPLYPVNLRLDGRACLVVGGGRVAGQKVTGLRECGARVHVVAPSVSEELKARAGDDTGLTWDERPYRRGEVAGYWLVVTCTDDPTVNRAVFADGEAARVWVNSADDTDNCGFLLPSRIRQGSLLVTFGTSGQAPGVSRWLRRRFSAEFGPEYAALIELVAAERRRIHDEGRTTEGLDWQAALDSGTLELIREGRLAEAKERLQACLSSSSD